MQPTHRDGRRWHHVLRCLGILVLTGLLGASLGRAQVFPGGGGGSGVPTFPQTTCVEQVVTGMNTTGVLTCQPVTPAMAPGLAPAGVDVNASGQVTGTHFLLPLPVSQGGTSLASGTPGGVLYFSGPQALVSSPLLPQHAPMLGGGDGGSPTTGTRSGTTLEFATVLGPHTSGKQLAFDIDGNIIATLVDIGEGGGGAGGGVTSVFGRTGAVVAQPGDYTAAQVTNAASLTAANVFLAPAGQAMSQLVLLGATAGSLTLRGASALGSSLVVLPAGLMDFSNSGGPGQVVRQSAAGGPLSVSTLALSDLTGAGNVCTTAAVCPGYQAVLGFAPENSANKDATPTLGTSDALYPTQHAVKTYVDTGLATKQATLGFTPENLTNKASSTALGGSDLFYPTQNAVKVYVDTGLATKQATLGFTSENSANKATTTTLGTSNLFYPTQNAVKVYVDTGLALKQNVLGFVPEDSTNKAPAPALGTSDTLYPTQNAVKAYVDTALALKQNTLGFVPESSANKAPATVLGTSDTLYPTQNAVKVYVDTGLALKQNSLGFVPESSANKASATALGTSNVLYPTQNAVKVYVDSEVAARQPLITWGPGLSFAGGTAAVASTQSGFLTNGGGTPLTCGVGTAGRMQVLTSGELQYCDGASVAVLRSGLPTQTGLQWQVTASACTSDANGGKLTLNPAGTQIVCASDIGGTGGTGGVDSVFGRTGAVVAQTGDYTAAQVTNAANLTTANIFTHASGQTMARLTLTGATSGSLSLRPPAVAGTSIVVFPAGSTDFTTTGGPSQVLRQSSLAGAITVSQLALTDLAGTLTQTQVPNLNTLTTGLTPLRCVETDATGKFTVAIGLCGQAGAGLPDPGANGFVVRTSATPTTINRTLTGTANQIAVTNGDGVAGNPVLSIPTNPTLPGTTTGTFSGALTGNASTATALAADPPACGANLFANDMAATGTLGCVQPTFANLGGTATAGQLPTALADGTTRGIVAFTVADFECTTGVCSLDYTNAQSASSTIKGFLTPGDWTTFNAKQAALGFTPEDVARKSTGTTLGTSDLLYPTQNAVKTYVDTTLGAKQNTVIWGAGLAATGDTARTASQEAAFLADGAAVDLTCGAANQGKMQVLDNGTLQYCDGATIAGLQTGRLTPPTLTWNVAAATCVADGNAGKLTVDGTNQIVCAADQGGAGAIASVGNCTTGACLNGTVTGGTFLALYDGDSHKGTLQPANLTADRTYTLPNESGTLCTSGSVCTGYQASLGFTAVPTTRTLTLVGTANQITVSPAGAQDLAANRTSTLSLPQNIDLAAQVRFGSLGVGIAAPATAGLLAQTAAANTVTLQTLKRFTDTTPAGAFVDYQSGAGASLWQIDITGTLTVGTVPGARVSGAIAGQAGTAVTLTDGDKGDVSCTAGVCMLDANAVTNPKLAAMPAGTLKGNATAGPAMPVDLPPATVKGMLGLTFGDLTGTATAAQLPNADANGVTKGVVALQANDFNCALGVCSLDYVTGPEAVANKSNAATLGASNTLYPTQGAVKTYVDSGVKVMTNTALTPRSCTLPNATPLMINADNVTGCDYVQVAALSQSTTFDLAAGTFVPGQFFTLRIFTAAQQALTFTTGAGKFAAEGLALPTFSRAGGYVLYGFSYNVLSNRWVLVASNQETTYGTLGYVRTAGGPGVESSWQPPTGGGGGTGERLLPITAVDFPATNPAILSRDTNGTAVLRFDNSVPQCVSWGPFRMNVDYSSNPVFKFQYSMESVIVGTVSIQVSIMAITPGVDAENPDNDANYTANPVCGNPAVPGTAKTPNEISCPLTSTDGLLARDLVKIRLCRNAPADTADGIMLGLAAALEYSR